MTTPMYDVAIVGGGPAGLTAAIFLGRYLYSVALIDSGDPRNWETRGINGYLGCPDITPPSLRKLGRDEARRYGATLINGCVDRVERLGEEHFRLTYTAMRLREDEERAPVARPSEPAEPEPERSPVLAPVDRTHAVEARRLLLTIGIKDVWPDVPGLEHAYGATVHHCPDCDGYEARGKKTVVIASGRKAAGMALGLATWTRELVICTNGEPANIDAENLARLDALNIPILVDRITGVVSRNGAVRHLELANGAALDCEKIFFAIGHYPADDLGAQLGCTRDEEELIVIDDHHHTSVRNVFAAGDITPGPHLAVRAAAGGAVAALSIHKSLLPEGLRLV